MSKHFGKMVWFDLITTDTAKAKKFYCDLVGWKTQSWKADEYDMWDSGDGQIGGVTSIDTAATKAGVPAHWMAYVAVEDVDAGTKQAQSLGAKVILPGTDIPDVGRFSIILDPTGANIALFKSKQMPTDPKPAMSNALRHISWAELNTTDWKKAWAFYETMFGWKQVKVNEIEHLGAYAEFGLTAGEPIGGMSNAATMMKARPHWLYYIVVEDCDATTKMVSKLGGKVLNGPMDIPGGFGRISQCVDPQGAVFGLHSEK